MNINIFRLWIKENDILNKTINGFNKCLIYYLLNEQEEAKEVFGQKFTDSQIEYKIKNISLILMDWDCKFEETIESKLIILYRGKEIGYYIAVYNLKSEIIDDYLVFD